MVLVTMLPEMIAIGIAIGIEPFPRCNTRWDGFSLRGRESVVARHGICGGSLLEDVFQDVTNGCGTHPRLSGNADNHVETLCVAKLCTQEQTN